MKETGKYTFLEVFISYIKPLIDKTSIVLILCLGEEKIEWLMTEALPDIKY